MNIKRRIQQLRDYFRIDKDEFKFIIDSRTMAKAEEILAEHYASLTPEERKIEDALELLREKLVSNGMKPFFAAMEVLGLTYDEVMAKLEALNTAQVNGTVGSSRHAVGTGDASFKPVKG